MNRRENYPSLEYIHACFYYREGILYWKERPREHFSTDRQFNTWNTRFAGKIAGSKTKHHRNKQYVGFRWAITLDGYRYQRSNIVWLFHGHSIELNQEIDHINTDSLDDRIDNLRIGTKNQNLGNTNLYGNNTSGYKGVSWDKNKKKYTAQIRINKRLCYLGQFDDPVLAHQAYMQKAVEVFGEFANSGEFTHA